MKQQELKNNCASCAHYNEEKNVCSHPDGKLKGISLSDDLATAEHDCNVFEEVHIKATPKGLLWIALKKAGIEMTVEELDIVWDSFEDSMEKAGYVQSQ